ncbi:hypothetical protein GCM10009608_23950 [Pseudonocardia alaniniphila]
MIGSLARYRTSPGGQASEMAGSERMAVHWSDRVRHLADFPEGYRATPRTQSWHGT